MPAYKLLVEFDGIDELKGYIGDLGGRELPAKKVAAAVEEVPQKKPKGFQKKETSEVAADEPEEPAILKKKPGRPAKVEAAVDEDAEDSATSAQEEIPYATVRDATIAYHKANGKEKTLELLKEFGVKIATELKAAQYRAYLNRVAELSEDGELA